MELIDQSVAPATQPQKLTDWKNPPTLTQLKQDLLEAKPIHDQQIAKIEHWLDHLNMTGSARLPERKKGEPVRSRVQPRLIKKQANWRYPALSQPFLSTDDLFNVRPLTSEDRAAAKQNSLVLNNQWNTKLNKVSLIGEMVRTAVDEGTVVARVGWCFEERPYEVEEPVAEFWADQTFTPTIEFLNQLQKESPSTYELDVPPELKEAHELSKQQGEAVRPQLTGATRWVTKMQTVRNHPTVEIKDFRHIVFDPTCNGDFTKANFAIESFESSIAQLTKDGNYINLDQIDTTLNTPLTDPTHQPTSGAANFKFHDRTRQKFIVQEYWGKWDIDGNGTTKSIVVAWVGNTIIRMEENPYPDGELPFVVMAYLPTKKSLYGEPDGALLIENQQITGALTRGMIDLMAKSANGQTGMRRDMLDATNRRKWEQGKDYEFNGNIDPRQGVVQHTYPEIPQSAFLMLNLQAQDAESLTGVKTYSDGINGNSLGQVAAGVRGVLDSSAKREDDILQRLKQGVVQIGRKITAMNAEFLDPEEVVRITDDEFVKVRRDDLAGNFDLRLTISTAEEDNAKAQELAFMLQTLGPNDDPQVRRMIQADIARLRRMPDLADKLENYKPEPDPVQQKLQELEMAKLEVEIAKLQAERAKIMADAGLAQAKIGTEQAKANQLQAQADMTNLEFVQEESGVNQERAKELQGEQARSQAQLALIGSQADRATNREKMGMELLKEYIKGRNKPKPK